MAKQEIQKFEIEPYAAPLPSEGDIIYVWQGKEESGGRARVSKVDDSYLHNQKAHFIEVKQLPGHSFNWRHLAKDQASLMEKYGDKIAYSHSARQEVERLAKQMLL